MIDFWLPGTSTVRSVCWHLNGNWSILVSICKNITKIHKCEKGLYPCTAVCVYMCKKFLKNWAYASEWHPMIMHYLCTHTQKSLQPALFHYVKSRCSFWLLVNVFSCAWHCCWPLYTECRQGNNASRQDFLFFLPAIAWSTSFFVSFSQLLSTYSHFCTLFHVSPLISPPLSPPLFSVSLSLLSQRSAFGDEALTSHR